MNILPVIQFCCQIINESKGKIFNKRSAIFSAKNIYGINCVKFTNLQSTYLSEKLLQLYPKASLSNKDPINDESNVNYWSTGSKIFRNVLIKVMG